MLDYEQVTKHKYSYDYSLKVCNFWSCTPNITVFFGIATAKVRFFFELGKYKKKIYCFFWNITELSDIDAQASGDELHFSEMSLHRCLYEEMVGQMITQDNLRV